MRKILVSLAKGPLLFINAIEYEIYKFLKQSAKTVSHESYLLDAGAGECKYKNIFSHTYYIAIDFARGDKNWFYRDNDVIGKLEYLPFKDESFDASVCTEVLEHVPEPSIVIGEIARVLKKGGSLYLTAPQGWGEHQKPYDFWRFTSYSLRLLAERNGYQVIDIHPHGGYFLFLGHNISYIPNYLFRPSRSPITKFLLLPIELMSYFIFAFCCPLICRFLDCIDKERDITLGYACHFKKK